MVDKITQALKDNKLSLVVILLSKLPFELISKIAVNWFDGQDTEEDNDITYSFDLPDAYTLELELWRDEDELVATTRFKTDDTINYYDEDKKTYYKILGANYYTNEIKRPGKNWRFTSFKGRGKALKTLLEDI